MERLSNSEANVATFGLNPSPGMERVFRTRLRAALSERVGNIGAYVRERYEQGGLDSKQLGMEIEELCGVRPSPQTVRQWIRAAGGVCRGPAERESINYTRTDKAERKRVEGIRASRRRKRYDRFVEENGVPFAAMTASKK